MAVAVTTPVVEAEIGAIRPVAREVAIMEEEEAQVGIRFLGMMGGAEGEEAVKMAGEEIRRIGVMGPEAVGEEGNEGEAILKEMYHKVLHRL